jgi:hypothetical protein
MNGGGFHTVFFPMWGFLHKTERAQGRHCLKAYILMKYLIAAMRCSQKGVDVDFMAERVAR